MEDFTFDMDGLLSEEEAQKVFSDVQEENGGKDKDNEPTDAGVRDGGDRQEEVGGEEITEEGNDAVPEGDGSSPEFFSSMASALKEDGIFPDFGDDEISGVKTADDFAELVEKAISSRLDARYRSIDAALRNGMQIGRVQQYEQTIGYLDSITDEAVEDEDNEDVRRQLIFNELVQRGYSDDEANEEVESSISSGRDIKDAKHALASLRKHFRNEYAKEQQAAKARADGFKAERKKNEEKFRKMVLEDEIKLGDVTLDKRTRQRVYDAAVKPVYKDPDTGRLLTEVQRFQKENPLEFLKQLGMWFVLTDGGKNLEAVTGKQVRTRMNKGIRELERKINSTSVNPDGSLNLMRGGKETTDPLLSDKWDIG